MVHGVAEVTGATLDRMLTDRRLPAVAAAVSLAIGVLFVLVWAPHPWGWYGIDQYHQLAVDLSEGQPFGTLDVPWGYGYFLAAFYAVFGPSPLPALLAQVALNACIPVFVYRVAARGFDRRVAGIAALLAATVSFNTIYASTEASDSVCTFLFMAMVWNFVEARHTGAWPRFVATGVLVGLAAQFRPNLLPLPVALAAFHLVTRPRTWRHVREAMLVVAMVALMLVPWTLRNFGLTGEFIPTSTHGGVQLWYGTLETGPHLTSRAHNPRRLFETPPFDYTSLTGQPVLFDVLMNCAPGEPDLLVLAYRTNHDTSERRVRLEKGAPRHYLGAIPAHGRDTTIYYWIESHWPPALAPEPVHTVPPGGAADPFVYFASTNHLGDLDADHRLLDVFDVVRVLRHLAWDEAVPAAERFDANGDGRVSEDDLRRLLKFMLRFLDRDGPAPDRLAAVTFNATEVRAAFVDGSAVVVPREWDGRFTSLGLTDGAAAALLSTRRRSSEPADPRKVPLEVQCLGPESVAINAPFFRVQPHEMRRYTALAVDNIRREPVAYALSVLYRAVRLFVILGSDDQGTAHQFAYSRLVYLLGTLVSGTFFVLALTGAWIGWRRGHDVVLPVLLVAYLPATIAFVLINMRYTVTVQPLLLIFVAVTIVVGLERAGWLPRVAVRGARLREVAQPQPAHGAQDAWRDGRRVGAGHRGVVHHASVSCAGVPGSR